MWSTELLHKIKKKEKRRAGLGRAPSPLARAEPWERIGRRRAPPGSLPRPSVFPARGSGGPVADPGDGGEEEVGRTGEGSEEGKKKAPRATPPPATQPRPAGRATPPPPAARREGARDPPDPLSLPEKGRAGACQGPPRGRSERANERANVATSERERERSVAETETNPCVEG